MRYEVGPHGQRARRTDAGRGRLSRSRTAVALMVVCGVVASTPSMAQEMPDPARFPHDPGLFAVLSMEPGSVQLDSMVAFESRVRYQLGDTLADIATNPDIHPLLRANAALLTGRRRDLGHFIILRPLLDEEDPRIRLAVVAAAQEFLPVLRRETLGLLRAALSDPEPAVQVRALEAIADRDAAALRNYLAGNPPTELASVAAGLLDAAEQRGAPLVPGPDGRLTRTGPAGGRLLYTPDRTWDRPDLSAGSLILEKPDGSRIELAESVEVARDVLPAFFSMDGSHVLFESGRTIHIYDVATGHTRTIGPGIAPRPLPFTDDFVFVRELEESRTETRGRAELTYEIRMASFAVGAEETVDPVGTVTAVASYDVTGGASPVRWMRVSEDEGRFSLRGDGIEPAPLPDPFESAGR